MIPIVYRRRYNITACGLEQLHPFDSAKYGRIRGQLIADGLRRRRDFVSPQPATRADLLRIHAPEYLDSLRRPAVVAQILELPLVGRLPALLVDQRILAPMRMATGGTLLACEMALTGGVAINLGGGYHHASPVRGHGFCVYADVPLALARLHDRGQIKSALVIDTDVHQGDGTADTIRNWPWAHLVDFYEQDVFPWPKVEEDNAVPLPAGTGGKTYLAALREIVPAALDRLAPQLVVYNAGSDVVAGDPLARLALAPEDVAQRDLEVISACRRRAIPVAMTLSGGYGPLSWQAHYGAIAAILRAFDASVTPN